MKKLKPPVPIQLLRPKNDFVFKLLFGSNTPASRELLINFINDLFQVPEGQSFSNIKLLNPYLNKKHLTDKASILDIRAQIPGATTVNIEIQLENQYNMDKRTLYYCAKMITEQLNEGDDYKKLRKTTTINLLDFNYFTHDHYHSIYYLTEKMTGLPYPDILQIHFIEMKKFKKTHQEGKIPINDRLAKWIEFITNEDDDQWKTIAHKHPIIKEAVNHLEIISHNPENRWEYEIRQKTLKDITSMKEGAKEEGIQIGIEKGIEKGEKVKAIKVAQKLIQKGTNIETIMEATELTRKEIEELVKTEQ